jgi:hypothetical protein
MEPMDAATIAGVLDERSEEVELHYDSRSYRCALDIGAALRPRTVRFQWQGILPKLRAPKLSAFRLPVRYNPVLSSAQETSDFEARKELKHFARLNNKHLERIKYL